MDRLGEDAGLAPSRIEDGPCRSEVGMARDPMLVLVAGDTNPGRCERW